MRHVIFHAWILVLWLISLGTCGAATVEKIVAECVHQMSLGICMAKRDISTIEKGATILISGAGRVSTLAYYDYVNTYDPKFPDNTTMCKLAEHYLINSPSSDHAKIARALWTPR